MPFPFIHHLFLHLTFRRHLESFEQSVKDIFVTGNADHEHVKAHLLLESLTAFVRKEVTSRLPCKGLLPLKFGEVRAALLALADDFDAGLKRPYHALLPTWDGAALNRAAPAATDIESLKPLNIELDTTGAKDKPQPPKQPGGSTSKDGDIASVQTPDVVESPDYVAASVSVESSTLHNDNTTSLAHWGPWLALANPTTVTIGKNHAELVFVIDHISKFHAIASSKHLSTKFSPDFEDFCARHLHSDHLDPFDTVGHITISDTPGRQNQAPILVDLKEVCTSIAPARPLNLLSVIGLEAAGWDVSYGRKLIQHRSGTKFHMDNLGGVWFTSATVWWGLETEKSM